MKKRQKKVYDDDDGRVISSMNVDGMPWQFNGSKSTDECENQASDESQIDLSPAEKRALMGGVFSAAMLVAGAFLLGGLLFVLFCVFVWLR